MYAAHGECRIYYETFGDPTQPTLLLVNGLGSQCINYASEWCEMFAAAGLHVVRFDNRDVGLSSWYDDAESSLGSPAYTFDSMALDAVAVLDAIEVERAHVMGLSMGGMLVQQLAIAHRERLLSMTSVMSRTGEPGYGEPTPEALAALTAPPPRDLAEAIAQHITGQRTWGSPAFADEQRWRADAERQYERAFNPAGVTRQFHAVVHGGSRAEGLRGVTTPTLVIHGDRDTLIHHSGGARTAELIAGAEFVLIEGMGHDYPPQLWARWVDLVAGFALTHS